MRYTRLTSQITLEGARIVVDAALAAASAGHHEVSVAVVDAAGQLVAFARTDGAELQTRHIAERKARSAAYSGVPTGRKSKAGNEGSDHHLLAITLAAGVDNMVSIPGGAPIDLDGACVGGVGVSGASRWDGEIAAAGVAAVGGRPPGG